MRTVHAQLTAGQAPAPGLPGVATRLLLEGYALADQPKAGLALAGQALRDQGRGMGRGVQLWEAEIRRLRATFLAARGAPPSRSRPNSSARSRWPSAKRHARLSNESWKRSRNALLTKVVPGR